jgi:hypothetical protein
MTFRIGKRFITPFFEGSNRQVGGCPGFDIHERENHDRQNSNSA